MRRKHGRDDGLGAEDIPLECKACHGFGVQTRTDGVNEPCIDCEGTGRNGTLGQAMRFKGNTAKLKLKSGIELWMARNTDNSIAVCWRYGDTPDNAEYDGDTPDNAEYGVTCAYGESVWRRNHVDEFGQNERRMDLPFDRVSNGPVHGAEDHPSEWISVYDLDGMPSDIELPLTP
jgi:hypothetical protein